MYHPYSFQFISERGGHTCQCKNDTIPMDREISTGLVKGCRKATFEELLSVVSCKKRFTLEKDNEWIPETTIETHFNGQYYAMSFYIHFPKGLKTISSLQVYLDIHRNILNH